MSARLSIMLFLLEEANRRDILRRRRQAQILREFHTTCRDVDFIRHYRLSEDLIDCLERDLTPLMPASQRSTGLTNRLKIMCTLSFLATGGYQKLIGKNVDTYVSQSSASRAIHQVVNAMNNLNVVKKYIRFPQNSNERQVLQERFYEKFSIPGVVGCVDGTLVSMIRPSVNEERYYCRKGYHARNVLIESQYGTSRGRAILTPQTQRGQQMINDADCNILHVDVTFGGATHDSFVFANSIIKQHLESLHSNGEVVYLLGDSGYAQRPYLMTPINNAGAGTPEELYNVMHCSARNSVERTIGILKGRFRCLLVSNMMQYDPRTVAKIVVAATVLHNMCNRAGLPAPVLEPEVAEEESRLLGILRQPHNVTHSDSLESGRLARQQLVDQLWRANPH